MLALGEATVRRAIIAQCIAHEEATGHRVFAVERDALERRIVCAVCRACLVSDFQG